jgi:hypothetical protein
VFECVFIVLFLLTSLHTSPPPSQSQQTKPVMISGAGRRNALRTAQCARRLSTTASNAAKLPHRAAVKAVTASEVTKRPGSTVATASPVTKDRPIPSPAFNRDDGKRNDVHALRSREVQLDHSFVGKTGGEIFHEMMLRHDVKHICKSFHRNSILPLPVLTCPNSRLPWWSHLARLRRHLQLTSLRFYPPEA